MSTYSSQNLLIRTELRIKELKRDLKTRSKDKAYVQATLELNELLLECLRVDK